MRWRLLMVCWLVILPGFSRAGEGLLFGPEWTFTNPQLINSQAFNGGLELLLDANEEFERRILEKCPTCVLKRGKISFAKDLWIMITSDSKVVEVNSSPMTIPQMRRHEPLLQRLVWDTAREMGLEPHSRIGGGHIHIEKPYNPEIDYQAREQKTFSWHRRLGSEPVYSAGYFSLEVLENTDIRLLRNFLVELWNTPELFLGGLGFNLKSAPPLSLQSESVLSIVERKLLDFDRGNVSIETLFRQINSLYANESSRDQAVNLSSPTTLEIRGIKPQTSFANYILLCDFFEKTIRRLMIQESLLPLRIPRVEGRRSRATGITQYFSSIPAEQIQTVFRNKVEIIDLNWAAYKMLMTRSVFEELTPPPALAVGGRCIEIFAL